MKYLKLLQSITNSVKHEHTTFINKLFGSQVNIVKLLQRRENNYGNVQSIVG